MPLIRKRGEPRGGRGKPCSLSIHGKSRHIQRWLLRNPWIHPFIVFSFAAGVIQKLARGFLVRKVGRLSVYISNRKKKESVSLSSKKSSGGGGGGPNASSKQLDKYLMYLDQNRGYNARKPAWLEGGYSVWCVVRIQAWWRMTKYRRRFMYQSRMIHQIAALMIQSAWRVKYTIIKKAIERKNKEKIGRISPIKASTRIQLAWRSFCNRRIYHYYKDLVLEKLQGAPQDLLRTIIPNESMLLDRAAGVLARFRLGGSVFPPKVYFKIFTYRGVCDVNAFAPRDYAREKPTEQFQSNVKSMYIPDHPKYNRDIRVGGSYFGTKVLSNTSTDNWYKREEKNTWRPIASHIFDDLMTPPWMKDVLVEKKPEPFHFSVLKRRTDKKKEARKKKKDWLRKAYMLAGVDLDKDKFTQLNENRASVPNQGIENRPGTGNSHFSHDSRQAHFDTENDEPRMYSSDQNKKFPAYDSKADNDSLSESLAYLSMSQSMEDASNEIQPNRYKNGYPPPIQVAEAKVRVSQNDGKWDSDKYTDAQNHYNNAAEFKGTTYLTNAKIETEDNDDLLQWSQALNFDDYSSDWGKIATSLPSHLAPN